MGQRLIDANAVVRAISEEKHAIPVTVPEASHELVPEKPYKHGEAMRGGIRKALRCIEQAPTVDAVPVNHDELNHLINDTIAYIWGMEDRGATAPEYGYDSRKALLEKLKRFEEEHFPENDACSG